MIDFLPGQSCENVSEIVLEAEFVSDSGVDARWRCVSDIPVNREATADTNQGVGPVDEEHEDELDEELQIKLMSMTMFTNTFRKT